MLLDPSTIGESGSALDKITGVSVTDATVDQALSIQLGIEFMNDNGGNVGANFSYTFASGETFTDITLAGAEIALNGTNPPAVGTISISDFGEFLLEGEALLKTGGSLDGVGSVTAIDVNADSIETVVHEGYIDTVIIDSNEITDLQSASNPISISEAIAFQDLKVSNSPTTFYVNDSVVNANSNLATLKSGCQSCK